MTPVLARPQRMVKPETPSDFFPILLIPPTPLSNQVGARWRLRRGRWVGFAQGRAGTWRHDRTPPLLEWIITEKEMLTLLPSPIEF